MRLIALIVTSGKRDLTPVLKSIESQTRKVDEIVIASEIFIDSFVRNDKYTLIINEMENGLARNTMNALAELSLMNDDKNTYIATLDDDDSWEPTYIENVEKEIKKGFNFIYSNIHRVVDGEKAKDEPLFPFTIRNNILGNQMCQGSNKVFELALALESGGMPMHLMCATDRAFNINLLRNPRTKYKFIDKKLVIHNADTKRERITNQKKGRKENLRNFYETFIDFINIDDIQTINKRHEIKHGIKDVLLWK